jgi:hypothetical protein
MNIRALPAQARYAILSVAFASIFLVGYIDGRTSAYIAFSIFYIVPIFVLSWLGNRWMGAIAAVTSALCGLAADVWTIGARPIYAYVNLGSRLMLFLTVSWAFTRIHSVLREEQQLGERERELSAKEREVRDVQRRLVQSVVNEARAPLGEIYAKVVDLGFEGHALSQDDLKDLLRELAGASVRVSKLVETLETEVADPALIDRAS